MELISPPDDHEVPQLFWDGEARVTVLMRQAYRDVDYRWCLEHVTSLFGVPAIGLMARIKRYAEGRQLTPPEEINWEVYPFMAIKYAHCEEGWESFRARKGRVNELSHLRAYFWEEDTGTELLMCITHFKLKKALKLDPADTQISVAERSHFLNSGKYYSDEKWRAT